MGARHTQAAEPGPSSEVLFREGRAAVAAADYVTARDKFAASYRLEQTAGAALNLALAEEKLGRFLSALEHVRAATTLLPENDERRTLTQELTTRVERKLGRLRFVAAEPIGASAEVARDGVVVSRSDWNKVIFVEPGHHVIVIRAPAHSERKFELDIGEGATLVVPIVLGVPIAPPSSIPSDPRRPSPDHDRSQERAMMTTWGWIAAAGAVASTGVSFGVGALALDRKATVDRECQATCSDEGARASSQGRTFATVATVAGISALVLAGASVTLFLARPHKQSALAVGLGRVDFALTF